MKTQTQKRKKTGGRQKGTPNKTTAELRLTITGFVGTELENLFENYKYFQIEDKINFIKTILPYAIPKQTENKISIEDENLKAVKESIDRISNIFV